MTLGVVDEEDDADQLFILGPAGARGLMSAAGIPFPAIAGLDVSAFGIAGGICLLLGMLVRPVAVLFAVQMAVAAVTVHVPHGFFSAVGGQGGYEYPLVLAGASAGLALVADPGDR